MRVLVWMIACSVAWPGVASAHAFLRSASPAVGGTVATSPPEIRIGFTEGVEPAFCTIALSGADGRAVAVGPVHLVQGDDVLAVALQGPLAAGRYLVTWHATAVDTHRTTGSFAFTVAPK